MSLKSILKPSSGNNNYIISAREVYAKDGMFINGVPVSSGTTPDPLFYYELDTQPNNFTGIWASNKAVTLTFERIGNLVTMSFPQVLSASNTAAHISIVTPIPDRFRPVTEHWATLIVSRATTSRHGSIFIDTDGTFNIGVEPSHNFFAGSGNEGVRGSSFTWLTS